MESSVVAEVCEAADVAEVDSASPNTLSVSPASAGALKHRTFRSDPSGLSDAGVSSMTESLAPSTSSASGSDTSDGGNSWSDLEDPLSEVEESDVEAGVDVSPLSVDCVSSSTGGVEFDFECPPENDCDTADADHDDKASAQDEPSDVAVDRFSQASDSSSVPDLTASSGEGGDFEPVADPELSSSGSGTDPVEMAVDVASPGITEGVEQMALSDEGGVSGTEDGSDPADGECTHGNFYGDYGKMCTHENCYRVKFIPLLTSDQPARRVLDEEEPSTEPNTAVETAEEEQQSTAAEPEGDRDQTAAAESGPSVEEGAPLEEHKDETPVNEELENETTKMQRQKKLLKELGVRRIKCPVVNPHIIPEERDYRKLLAESNRKLTPRQLFDKKIVATIKMSDMTKANIRTMLEQHTLPWFTLDSSTHLHVEDSAFKREYLESIYGSIEQKILPFPLDWNQDECLDRKLFYSFRRAQERAGYLKQREELPVYSMKDELLMTIDMNQVVVISGETGCGKTTQIPQFILDDAIGRMEGTLCRVVCTQPRRISAISIAERVAEERGEKLGESVGYSVRLDRILPRPRGSIAYCTVGILIRYMEWNPALNGISHVILDEIHERDVLSDFLLCLVKQLIQIRKNLKVILMSATMNAESFANYFGGVPHVLISGRSHPVEELYLEDVVEVLGYKFPDYASQKRTDERKREDREHQSEVLIPFVEELKGTGRYSNDTLKQLLNPLTEELNYDLIVKLLAHISEKKNDGCGAILVFLPGHHDICRLLWQMMSSGHFPRNRFDLMALHSQLPPSDQRAVFRRSAYGVRKIVVSTNIAETSVTLEDVLYVVDCGRAKVQAYDADTNVHMLQPNWVSRSSVSQRRGRAGRVRPGHCYHLFTRARLRLMDQFQTPEVLCVRLEDTILKAKKLQLGKISPFFGKLMDPPSDAAVAASLDILRRMSAVDDEENLTPLGYHIAKLPMPCQMAKMLLFATIFGCLEPVLSIAVFMAFKDPFVMPIGQEWAVREAKEQMLREESVRWCRSDHLLFLYGVRGYEGARDRWAFCHERYLSLGTMRLLVELKRRFLNCLHEMGYVRTNSPRDVIANVNSENLSLVKAVVCAGLYPNVVIKRGMTLADGMPVCIHPKSVLSKRGCLRPMEQPMMVFHTLVSSSQNFIHDATPIHPLPVVLFGDRFVCVEQEGRVAVSVGDDLWFRCSASTCEVLRNIRSQLGWFLGHKLTHPGKIDWRQMDNPSIVLLTIIKDLITWEDDGLIEKETIEEEKTSKEKTGKEKTGKKKAKRAQS